MSVPNMINALIDDDKLEAESSFKNSISQKVGDALDMKRIEVANSIVKQHIPTEIPDEAEEV